MYKGDRSRKETLVEYGFRLPSALDNRPLKFEEWERLAPQMIFVSATPGRYEAQHSGAGGGAGRAADRPGGSRRSRCVRCAPRWTMCSRRSTSASERNERVLVTTLTKRMAEDLTEYLHEHDVRVRYLHADIETVERTEIIRDLRLGVRRAGGHQSAARRPGHAGGVAGGDPGCGQGGVPALGQLADPDHRPRGAQYQWARHPLRGQGHRLDAAGDG